LRDWRSALLQDVQGEVLELGCGTGANLPFLSQKVSHLAIAEPNKYMRQKFAAKQAQFPQLNVTLLDYNGEMIPLPNESVDAVVSTLVLCTVDDSKKTLNEIYRILKPQAKLYFIEHVAALNNPGRLKWQNFFEPVWHVLGCGCHLTRQTEQSIIQAGFIIQGIKRESMRGVPPIVRPSIRGVAVKSN
jgi:ubiquinone/menaquinone biosynthesis C-methylase UbiE